MGVAFTLVMVALRKLFIFVYFLLCLTDSLNLNFFIISSRISSSGLMREYLGVLFYLLFEYLMLAYFSAGCFFIGWLGNPVF